MADPRPGPPLSTSLLKLFQVSKRPLGPAAAAASGALDEAAAEEAEALDPGASDLRCFCAGGLSIFISSQPSWRLSKSTQVRCTLPPTDICLQ